MTMKKGGTFDSNDSYQVIVSCLVPCGVISLFCFTWYTVRLSSYTVIPGTMWGYQVTLRFIINGGVQNKRGGGASKILKN